MQVIKYSILTLIIVFGLIDMGRVWINFSNTKKNFQHLQAELQQKETVNTVNQKRSVKKIASKEKMVDHILPYIELSGLSLEYMSVMNDLGAGYEMDCVVFGDFQQIKTFFQFISRQCFPIFMDYVELSKSKNGLKLKMKLRILNYCVKSMNVFFTQNKEIRSEHFSVSQLRWVGFLKYKKKVSAIILLPNKESREIVVGDVLGDEHATVIQADEKGILLEWNGKMISIRNNNGGVP